jgi:hypothetical protein
MQPALLVLVAVTAASAQPSNSDSGLAYYENPSTLWGVAKRFQLSVDEIAKLNGIKDANHLKAHGLLLPDTPRTRSLPRYVAWAPASLRPTCAVTTWTFVDTNKLGCSACLLRRRPQGRTKLSLQER